MSVGLVGPEFTLHLAWIQFVLARWVVREMEKGGKRSVLWMVVQAIGRKANVLPLTLLEHVASVLAMYALSFNKPQDVRRPTEIAIPDDTEGSHFY